VFVHYTQKKFQIKKYIFR